MNPTGSVALAWTWAKTAAGSGDLLLGAFLEPYQLDCWLLYGWAVCVVAVLVAIHVPQQRRQLQPNDTVKQFTPKRPGGSLSVTDMLPQLSQPGVQARISRSFSGLGPPTGCLNFCRGASGDPLAHHSSSAPAAP